MSEFDERDLRQRTFGMISVSVLAHAGLLALLVISPRPGLTEVAAATVKTAPDVVDVAQINEPTSDLDSPAAANDLSDDDSSAVLVAANDPVATPEPKATPKPKPTPKPAPKTKHKKMSASAAPKATPEVKTEAKSEQKPEQKADVESLTPAIESPKNEQAELAAARQTEDQQQDQKDDNETPAKTPVKPRSAKSAEGTPEPITTSFEKAEATPAEKSDVVVAPAVVQPKAVKESTATAPTPESVPADAQIRDADKLTTLSTKPFAYPQADRLANRSGTAYVVAKVRADGAVEDVRLERSSGSKAMDQEAVRTFKQWKFSPNQEGYVRKAVQFVLKNEAPEADKDAGPDADDE